MLAPAQLHKSVCAACRLRAGIATKQLARSRKAAWTVPSERTFATNGRRLMPRSRPGRVRSADHARQAFRPDLSVEERVIHARQVFGDDLPEGLLGEEDLKAYERLYGKPLYLGRGHTASNSTRSMDEGRIGRTHILREGLDGTLEEIALDAADLEAAEGSRGRDGLYEGPHDAEVREEWGDTRTGDDNGAPLRTGGEEEEQLDDNMEEEDLQQRTHPLTLANRFGTAPSTLNLPKESFVDPAILLLSGMPSVHLAEAAHRVFGGTGLPYSAATPAIGKTMQARPIALDASQGGMSEIEGDVFMATLMPSMFASTMSVLVETRKRLGTLWAESMVEKAVKGELRILDAGGAGAGVLAVREFIRAEWERMHESAASEGNSPRSLAKADGKVGGAAASPPLGTATVLTGSDALRRRASQLLENTSFIPRLPDYIHTETAKQKGKFDIVIAPHTLWPLRDDYTRKTHAQNLWSMLSTEGGVLLLLEKGVARGFELIASAREMLLESRIGNNRDNAQSKDIYEPEIEWEGDASGPDPLSSTKEKGMIIAPCTNHQGCPMYVQRGMIKGRKDICHFEQRYIRPSFLQKIIGARDKNFEDVKFSYIAVMRGQDLREPEANSRMWEDRAPVIQSKEMTDLAFEGFEASGAANTFASLPDSLSLPRAILPPLKRRGHVILDLCTSSGTLERWTVPRSFSKQAFRDARKSSWGDLWALGAKTRVPRNISKGPKHGNKKDKGDLNVKGRSKKTKGGDRADGEGVGVDEYGRLTLDEGRSLPVSREGGKMRTGHKIKGIRDKRDKKGHGNGRLKWRVEE